MRRATRSADAPVSNDTYQMISTDRNLNEKVELMAVPVLTLWRARDARRLLIEVPGFMAAATL
jgi:hypothetical protein